MASPAANAAALVSPRRSPRRQGQGQAATPVALLTPTPKPTPTSCLSSLNNYVDKSDNDHPIIIVGTTKFQKSFVVSVKGKDKSNKAKSTSTSEYFWGTVVSKNNNDTAKQELYLVEYDDGDTEELDAEVILELVQETRDRQQEQEQQQQQQQQQAVRVVTPIVAANEEQKHAVKRSQRAKQQIMEQEDEKESAFKRKQTKKGAAVTSTSTPTRRVSKRRKTTPVTYKENDDDDNDDDVDVGYQDSSDADHEDNEEESVDDDLHDKDNLQEDLGAEQEAKKPPANYITKSNNIKKQPSTPSPPKTKTTKKKSTSGTTSTASSGPSRTRKKSRNKKQIVLSPNSVAVCGLPQGSRAVGRGGFEIRTLDGIPPLLTPVVVQKAIQLVAKGQHQAAARLVCMPNHQHDCIRAFLKSACDRLKLSQPQAISLEGGSPLSAQALERLEQGTVDVHADLPGRLLVVKCGTSDALLLEETESSNKVKRSDDCSLDAEPLCPPELEGCTFESAAALHALTKERLATYADMQATRETSFCPWNVLIQRLETAGLVPTATDDEDIESFYSNGHNKCPFLVKVYWNNDRALPTGSWEMYQATISKDDEDNLQWALLEGVTRDAPPVILGVSPSLINYGAAEKSLINPSAAKKTSSSRPDVDTVSNNTKDFEVLPTLSAEVEQVRLPASLLQKAIRRNFCSPAPVLEACHALLCGKPLCKVDQCENDSMKMSSTDEATSGAPPLGGVFAMLSTTWRSMLEDASPFDAPDDGSLLGIDELLLLSLVAKANDSWQMPQSLLRKAVATALRTQQQPANLANIDMSPDPSVVIWKLQEEDSTMDRSDEEDSVKYSPRGLQLKNSLLVLRAVVGIRTVHRTSLNKTEPIQEHEIALVDRFEQGLVVLGRESRLITLDNECRLAAYDSHVSPSSLLLLQATLPTPPASWKKYSLPAISRQVKKLVTEVNARMPDHHRLVRLSAWGLNNNTDMLGNSEGCGAKEVSQSLYMSAREVATMTGKLSDKEHEIIDCFETVQRWREQQQHHYQDAQYKCDPDESDSGAMCETKFTRVQVGSSPMEHDGRMAFLLAFAKSEEIEVCPQGGNPETVNVLFCGDADEPLLVQLIGKARREAEMHGPEGGASGAKAVPSLGYVKKSRSQKDKLLVEAAEQAVAKAWKHGRTVALPLPPPGFQWNLGAEPGQEEEAERAVKLTATLSSSGKWQFSIGGIDVKPFDARTVISPCSLNPRNHKPVALEPEREQLLCTALYCDEGNESTPESILHTLTRLHDLAVNARKNGANEGFVYDWLPLATEGRLTPPIWRDAILALKTREREDVILGPVLADGTCRRDMTEGCILRIYHVLESLYPTVLIKNGALKWRIRQRGAGYNHMLGCLELLSRGAVEEEFLAKKKQPAPPEASVVTNGRKQSGRQAAARCKMALALGDEIDTEDLEEASSQVGKDVNVSDKKNETLPKVTTKLWPHQEASVAKVVSGVREGRRGHADASAVGAGKTLTALAIVVKLAALMETRGKRNGVLVMLPTKALVKEWLLQIAAHTHGFHVVEQREDGQLFSLTYGRSGPPIDGNTIVISTLDRVREHPFKHQAAWDFVVIDECLAIQNADAKRCPSAWRQIEVSTLGVLMLSATFFRSKYSDLFYMIRMLRTVFPRSMEWLSATIHEHIVCQVPETDRTWQMVGKPVALPPADLKAYRAKIEAYKRKQLNTARDSQDFRRLFTDLEAFLRVTYEGRQNRTSYSKTSVLGKACLEACEDLLKQGHRPLVFADTAHEADHLLQVLCNGGLNARKWASVARDNVAGVASKSSKKDVIVAVKSVEGQGINMQGHADAIVCRPTPGDHLEQMKGRIDRPGQASKKLVLVVLMAEHTIEEAKFANIHLAGNFFREYIAPVATRYRERIDLEATLAAGGTAKLKPGTVSGTWRRSLEAAGQSGAFANINSVAPTTSTVNSKKRGQETEDEEDIISPSKHRRGANGRTSTAGSSSANQPGTSANQTKEVPQFAPLNKVLRNKGDPEAVRQAKARAQKGDASLAVRNWLFPPKKPKATGLPRESLLRFSNIKPPIVLDSDTVHKAVMQLSKDAKLASLIARVGADALIEDCGEPKPTSQAKFFDNCVRAITFTMVSVDAGNAFLRRLGIKIGVAIEQTKPTRKRNELLDQILAELQEGHNSNDDLTTEEVLNNLLAGLNKQIVFTPIMLNTLVKSCLVIDGKQTGYPHLCGVTEPCGKHDNPSIFLQFARDHAAGGDKHVSAGFSKSKADFLIGLVEDFASGKVSAEKIAKASDREAAKMLLHLKGIGDWSAGQILMHFLKRANIMLYGDLTVRNYLNDLYDINHKEDSETMLQSAADFPDTRENRNRMDALCEKNGWEPYRSVVCLLMYHLQEENLVLL